MPDRPNRQNTAASSPPRGKAMGKADYRKRWARCRAVMEAQGVDLLVLTPGPNMTYMTGFLETPGERLLAALLPRDGEPRMVVPALYEEQVGRE
ncbi:MAG: aminopeptidase P family N-terminal domain-containing protein, partial [Thermoplasmata archaeon]|nr:aminopeptidase P family N-terminal domain-containing protein [Thermoplasmata archaeon]